MSLGAAPAPASSAARTSCFLARLHLASSGSICSRPGRSVLTLPHWGLSCKLAACKCRCTRLLSEVEVEADRAMRAGGGRDTGSAGTRGASCGVRCRETCDSRELHSDLHRMMLTAAQWLVQYRCAPVRMLQVALLAETSDSLLW